MPPPTHRKGVWGSAVSSPNGQSLFNLNAEIDPGVQREGIATIYQCMVIQISADRNREWDTYVVNFMHAYMRMRN